MLGKLFGQKTNREDKEYSQKETQDLSKKFIKNYVASSGSNSETVNNVIRPLYKEISQDTQIQKYKSVIEDIKSGQYNKESLQIFAGMLFKELHKEKKDGVYEDMAKNLAADVVLEEDTKRSNTRLKTKAGKLLDAYRTSAQQVRQIRQDAEFAKAIQEGLRLDEDTEKAVKLSRKSTNRSDTDEEEKREEGEYMRQSDDSFYNIDADIQPNIPYSGSSSEHTDRELAMKLQQEEDNKATATISAKPKRIKFQERVPKKNDISPDEILRRRQQRSEQSQDMLNTIGGYMPLL
ncbi:MAG: hypothetical protein PQ612_02620 [Rickettsiales bacterium]|nr:hypothetical protein [Pseudomonadota bacterium]MDA0965993.1 hypothetical protein [Pseudomonadota bacterium]MDG4542536.1 hypothetical protein [Rickettsiales bacterium]MDG4545040.1 hypothetical protein [Rickettsiales bacterium]MDG4547163.1 hypothetical protein [Rickettsiales bacterium]